MAETEVSIDAEGLTIYASETVSTGDYENADVGATLEASVTGADLTDGMPEDVKQRAYALERTMQNVVKAAAADRKREGAVDGT